MKYEAVIFDLFGTLASNFSTEGYYDALAGAAVALSLPDEDFKKAWFGTSKERNGVASQTCETDIECICRHLEAQPTESQVREAIQARLDYIRLVMTPQPQAVETLSCLREDGYKTALLSNCSHEIPVVWPETELAPLMDVALFSCSVKMRKPDPGIYQLTIERLGVRPEGCLYVGDGGHNELSAAISMGMHPVLIRPDANSEERHLKDREDWDGPELSSLADVLALTRDGPRP